MILVIKHVSIEGPGIIGDFFSDQGHKLKILDLEKRGSFPDLLEGIEAVISLGGPMNVYQEYSYPFLRTEDAFIRNIVKKGMPFLGICLGAQLLAKAAGAPVKKAPRNEIGFYRVSLTREGRKDPLFAGINDVFDVFQWHEDTFEVPEGGRLLAVTDPRMNQAIKLGNRAYGLQFHVETTEGMIKRWIREYLDGSDTGMRRKGESMLSRCDEVKNELQYTAIEICGNFRKMFMN